MNPIQTLKEHIERRYAPTAVEIERPLRPDGFWSLDVSLPHKRLIIEWREATGFGITSANPASFGETADEQIESLADAQRRIDELLSGNERTTPPYPVLLRRLRENRGISQTAIAKKLGVQQATISGMERRADIQLSTMTRIIWALDGALEMWAVFPDGRYRIDFTLLENRQQTANVVSIHPIPKTAPSNDDHFFELRESGLLECAHRAAIAIHDRGSIVEMP